MVDDIPASKITVGSIWLNKKSRIMYEVVDPPTKNSTDAQYEQEIVAYRPLSNRQLFVCEKAEFIEEFSIWEP